MIISFTDIKLYQTCKRCFYVKKKLNVQLPGPDPDRFFLANVVDELMKEEADIARTFDTTLPIMQKNKIQIVPFNDLDLIKQWRMPYYVTGAINYTDPNTNLIFCGSVDDVFITDDNKLTVVDYKFTAAKSGGVKNKSREWDELQISYYTWLLAKNNRIVSDVGYLIYARPYTKSLNFMGFGNQLRFKRSIVRCKIDYSKIEEAISQLNNCLNDSKIPEVEKDLRSKIKCDVCKYYHNMRGHEL